ncbi:hypothetical protein FIV31_06810 [Coxiella endosymbiont of Ornithodoros amblus]|uniref:hypothetical protein n=1 Tax=Coxiella endosymbiont of Ornithodoros amblus TaxID=1656166 RepID=UPI00244E1D98|nr:hypothetical protein [Coxiella endosymbiont of Ornithodoros amblus]MBW5802998.1 hypothetical protein [Coxiella endosymbiont of Ornithodoros amblus]
MIEHSLQNKWVDGYIIYWLMKDDVGVKLFFDPQGGLLYSFKNEGSTGWSAAFFSLLLFTSTAESIFGSLWL